MRHMPIAEILHSYEAQLRLGLGRGRPTHGEIQRMIRDRDYFPAVPEGCSVVQTYSYLVLPTLKGECGERLPEVESHCLTILRALDCELIRAGRDHGEGHENTKAVNRCPDLSCEWLDLALDDAAELEQGLAEAGVKGEVAEACLKLRRDLERELAGKRPGSIAEAARRGRIWQARQTLERLLGLVEHKCVDTRAMSVEIPVFWLSSPNAASATTDFTVTEATGESGGWTISVLGFGFGCTRSVSFSITRPFHSEGGARRLIYAPVDLDARLMQPFKDGEPSGEPYWRVEAAPVEAGLLTHCCKTVGPDESDAVLDRLTRENRIQEHTCAEGRLAQAEPSDLIFEWEAQTQQPLVLDVPVALGALETIAMPVKLGVKFDVKYSSKVKLACKLPAGHGYTMLRDTQGTGVWWS